MPSTTRTGTPLELRCSGPPSAPTSRPRCPRSTWRAVRPTGDMDAYAGEPGPARGHYPCGQRPPPRLRGRGDPGPGRRPVRTGRPAPPGARAAAPAARPPPRPGPPAVMCRGPVRRDGGRSRRASSRDATGCPASGPAGRGECAADRSLERGGLDGCPDPDVHLSGAAGAPGGTRRREPTARAVPGTEAAARSAPIPYVAVPRGPASRVGSRAPAPPPGMSGHGGLHRAPGARTGGGRVGVELLEWRPRWCASGG